MAVEEEQFVLAPGLADRAADRVAEIFFVQHRLGVAVERVRLAVGVPVGFAHHVVERSAEAVGAALGDGGDLQSARSSVFSLVARRKNFDFCDRLDVHLQQHGIAAGVHRRDAVHHDVVRAAAADARRVGAGAGDAGRDGGQLDEAPVGDGQVLDRFGRHGERPLAASQLNDRRLSRHENRFSQRPDFDRQRPHDHPVAWAHLDS